MTNQSDVFSSMTEFFNSVGTDQLKSFNGLAEFIASQKFDPYWVLDFSQSTTSLNVDAHSATSIGGSSQHISDFLKNQAINGVSIFITKSLANKFFEFTDTVISKHNIQYFLLDLLGSVESIDKNTKEINERVEVLAFDLMLLTLINYLSSGIGVIKRRKGLTKGAFDLIRSAYSALNNNKSFFENYCNLTGGEEKQVINNHVPVRVNRDVVAFLITCHKPLGLIDHNELDRLCSLYLRNNIFDIYDIEPPPYHPLHWSLRTLVTDKRTVSYFKKFHAEFFENWLKNLEEHIKFIEEELPYDCKYRT